MGNVDLLPKYLFTFNGLPMLTIKRIPLSLLMAGLCLLLVALIFVTLRPLAPATVRNTEEVQATLIRISEGTSHDLLIELKDDPNHYYINRGLEQGLHLQELKNELEGKEIRLRYIKHWSLLNPVGRARPLAQLSADGKAIFNAMVD